MEIVSRVKLPFMVIAGILYSVGFWLLEAHLQLIGVSDKVISIVAVSHNFLSVSICAFIFYKSRNVCARRLWVFGFILVGVSDVFHGVFGWVYPISAASAINVIAAEGYTLYAALLLISYYLTFKKDMIDRDWLLLALLAISVFSAELYFISYPYFMSNFPWYMKLFEAVYSSIIAVLVAMMIMTGMRAKTVGGLLFNLSFLLIFCSDFAIRHYDNTPFEPKLTLFNYGWELGFSFLALISVAAFVKGGSVKSVFEVASRKSMRAMVASACFASLVLFAMIVLGISGNVETFDAPDLSIILFVFLFSWLIANMASQWVSSSIIKLKCMLEQDENINLDMVSDEISAILRIYRHINKRLRHTIMLFKNQKSMVEGMCRYISHDMRSPLSILRGYVNSSVDTNEIQNDSMTEYRACAERSIDKLVKMSSDLSDYSRAANVDYTLIELSHFFNNHVLKEVCLSAKSNRIDIRCFCEEGLVSNIDIQKMGRAMVSMINNAVEAIKEPPGEIHIDIKRSATDGIHIKVVDNGCGVPEDNIDKIFDAYFTQGKKGGTGLGLAYCKQVVEAHGGTIDVESEVGKGTAFTICIPDCVVDEKECSAFKNDPQINCQNRCFIIVDDDSDIRMRWRKIVQQSGGTVVHEASSLEDVVAKDGEIDYRDIDVAMVDYHYEGSKHTGADVIRHMRSRGVAEVHLCTGFYDDESVRDEAFSAGADSVIPKG